MSSATDCMAPSRVRQLAPRPQQTQNTPSSDGPKAAGMEAQLANVPDDAWGESSFVIDTSPAPQSRSAEGRWGPSAPGLSTSPKDGCIPGLPAFSPTARANEPHGFACGFGRVPTRTASFEAARASLSPPPVANTTLAATARGGGVDTWGSHSARRRPQHAPAREHHRPA